MSDILKDPTAHLHRLLTEPLDPTEKLMGWMQLHLHLAAGGVVPEQWRGEGTAVGALLGEVADLRKAAADWSLDLQQQAVAQLERADDLRRGSSAVTGEG